MLDHLISGALQVGGAAPDAQRGETQDTVIQAGPPRREQLDLDTIRDFAVHLHVGCQTLLQISGCPEEMMKDRNGVMVSHNHPTSSGRNRLDVGEIIATQVNVKLSYRRHHSWVVRFLIISHLR